MEEWELAAEGLDTPPETMAADPDSLCFERSTACRPAQAGLCPSLRNQVDRSSLVEWLVIPITLVTVAVTLAGAVSTRIGV